MEEPASDDILEYFQDLRSRESKRTASLLAARRRILPRVTLTVLVAIGVLFILTLLR